MVTNKVNTLFQVRLSVIVMLYLIRRHPELDSGTVVFRHVVYMRMCSSGSRVKHGMTCYREPLLGEGAFVNSEKES